VERVNSKYRIRCSKETIIWSFIMIGFFESPFLARFPVLDAIYSLLKISAIVFIVVNYKKIRIDKILVLVILYEMAQWYSTFRKGSSINETTITLFTTTVFALMINIMIRRDANKLVTILYTILELLIYLNVISVLFYPNGLYTARASIDITRAAKKYYFLGHQNAPGIYIVEAIVLGEIKLRYSKERKDKIRLLSLYFVSFYYLIRVWSVASFVGVGILVFLIWIDRAFGKGLHLKLQWVLIGNLVLFVFLVVMQDIDLFSSFITNVLQRKTTLSGRTIVWTKAIRAFCDNPIWGNGTGVGRMYFGYETAHNRLLNTLFTGGIVSFCIYMGQMIVICTKLKNTRIRTNRLLIFGLTAMMLMMQAETYGNIICLTMMIIPYYSERFS